MTRQSWWKTAACRYRWRRRVLPPECKPPSGAAGKSDTRTGCLPEVFAGWRWLPNTCLPVKCVKVIIIRTSGFKKSEKETEVTVGLRIAHVTGVRSSHLTACVPCLHLEHASPCRSSTPWSFWTGDGIGELLSQARLTSPREQVQTIVLALQAYRWWFPIPSPAVSAVQSRAWPTFLHFTHSECNIGILWLIGVKVSVMHILQDVSIPRTLAFPCSMCCIKSLRPAILEHLAGCSAFLQLP